MIKQLYISYFLSPGLLTYLAVLFFAVPCQSASIDPSLEFSTIETDHFAVHYHQGLKRAAVLSADILEDVHGKITETFRWSPKERTQVVLLDNTDFANGRATVLPYNAVYINMTPPFPDLTISESRDWLELVLIHEYVHILTLDAARGYALDVRSIFGKPVPGYDPLSSALFLLAAPPNIFLPDWWTEGIATWAETEFTGSGRGRSSFVEMIFRMAVQENKLPSIDQANGDIPYWPSGSTPYVYGMLIQQHIALTYGNEMPGNLSHAHSGRLPFLINAPPRQLTGQNYINLYTAMINNLTADQKKKFRQLQTRPFSRVLKLPFDGERITHARISPDGSYMAVNRVDPHDHEEIVIYELMPLKEAARVRRLPSDHSLSWSRDGKLYFTQAAKTDLYNLFQDIYVFDMNSHTVSRVTHNLRTTGIDISPDGNRAVFIKTLSGVQNLAVLTLTSGEVQICTSYDGPVLSSPKWSPDGTSIVYSRRDRDGTTSLELFHVGDEKIDRLVRNSNSNLFPAWSVDGKHIIYSSDETGVYNLFAYTLENRNNFQISHLAGGAFHPEPSGKEIYFTRYTATGFDIVEIPYDPSQWFSEYGPYITSQDSDDQNKSRYSSFGRAPSSDAYAIKKYSPQDTITPRFWLPTLSYDDEGAVLGLFTAGHDVLGYHSYIVRAGHGASGRSYVDFNYVYDRHKPTYVLRAYSLPVYYADLFADDSGYYERSTGTGLEVRYPLPMSNLESSYSLRAGINLERVQNLTDIKGKSVDGQRIFEGRQDSLFAGFTYTGALRYPMSISAEEGREFSVIIRNYVNGPENREYLFDYQEYIGRSLNHVIYLNVSMAFSDGNSTAQQSFQLGGAPYIFNRYFLRGFPSNFDRGQHVVKFTAEYRLPLYYIFRGWNTKPVLIDRLHLALFADTGSAWQEKEEFELNNFSTGVGAEIKLDTVLGYKTKITPSLGVAQGLSDEGETQVYFIVYADI